MALPSKDEIVDFVAAQEGRVGKREIARAFGIKGADRVELKRVIRELIDEGRLGREADRAAEREPGVLPPVTLLEAGEPDADGELAAHPALWRDEDGPAPAIVVAPERGRGPAIGPGDRFIGRLTPLEEGGAYAFRAEVIKKLGKGVRRALGVFQEGAGGARVRPVEKRQADDYAVAPGGGGGAKTGELVEIELLAQKRYGLQVVKVLKRLGDPSAPRSISLIAIHEHGLPVEFSDAALAEAEAAAPFAPTAEAMDGREDLRHLPLLTIDPDDARDHDDAVAAHPDPEPDNPGGWVVWVAIADVAHYVRPGSALDQAARERGNSAYFPDRVVPMLPDRLSGDLCSLHELVDRPVLAARMRLSAAGERRGASFHRGVMRSAASLTYAEAQEAIDGAPSARAAPLLETALKPLFAAYAAAAQAREARAPLELELPEREVRLSEAGEVESVRYRERLSAHRLIEEFMILANVAAAEALEAARLPPLYRVHDEPDPERIDALREILDSIGVSFAKGQVMTSGRLNRVLQAARESEHAELVNIAVLRAQAQAFYSPRNVGHFGLSLRAYAHFTSPIRRYADLLIHRALIAALDRARTGAKAEDLPSVSGLETIGEHISMTERRAMTAERDTTDRYLAAFLAGSEGAIFDARIAGVQRFGLFVKLDETGADGFVPVSSLGEEYFRYDEDRVLLVGERSGASLGLGMAVRVRLKEATPISGGLVFELLELPAGAREGRRGARGRGRASRKTEKRNVRPGRKFKSSRNRR